MKKKEETEGGPEESPPSLIGKLESVQSQSFVAANIKESPPFDPEPIKHPAQKAIAEISKGDFIFCDYGLGDRVCPRCGSKKVTGINGQPQCAIALPDCPFIKK